MQLEKKELKNSAGEIYVTIYFDSEAACTVDVWTGNFETIENFTYGLMTVLQNIKHFNAKKWLADLSRIDGDFEFAKSFIADTIVPQAIRYGLQFEALVLPDNIFAMLSVQETLQKIDHLEICCFGTVEEAKEWLANKTPVEVSSNQFTAQ
ncbi:MAG TPA: hypothetical protein VGD65_20900 [Chryseosolibacter sp.]